MYEKIILELKEKGYSLKEEKGEFSIFYYMKKNNDLYTLKKNLITGEGNLGRTINGMIEDELELNCLEKELEQFDNKLLEKEKKVLKEEVFLERTRVRHIKKLEWGIGYIEENQNGHLVINFSQDKAYNRIISEKRSDLLKKFDKNEESKGVLKYTLKEENINSLIKEIIKKVQVSIKLTNNEIEILKENKFYDVIAKNYELSEETIAKSSSYWRRANNPERVLEITKNINIPSVLTTRGGACRDLNKEDEAILCGEKAINIGFELNNSTYYPYNLLGSIYYNKNEKAKAETYFKIALELGSPHQNLEYISRRFRD